MGELPEHLRRENTVVEDWVAWSEQPPGYWSGEPAPHLSWRRLQAWRRWQAAVTEWGTGRGLDYPELRALGLWPIYPPRFGDTSRLTGQRFY